MAHHRDAGEGRVGLERGQGIRTNASVAKIVVVYARSRPQKHDISAFIVPTDAAGFSVLKKEDKMGIRATIRSPSP